MSDNDGDENTAEDRRERYHKLLRAVELNTGTPWGPSPQTPAARLESVVANLTRAGNDGRKIRATIRAAESNGDLLRVEIAGRDRLARQTEESLRALATWAAEREEPEREVVALANRALS